MSGRGWRDVVVDAMDSIDETTRIGAKVRSAILVVAYDYPEEDGEGYIGSVQWFTTGGPSYERVGLLDQVARSISADHAAVDDGDEV